MQDRANEVTIIGGDGINNVDATTHYSYNRVYATNFIRPLPENDLIAKSFIQQGFSKPPFVNAVPSHLWIPGGTLLSYDAVSAFARTVQDRDFAQQDGFNDALATVSFKGASGEVTFQGNRSNNHRSDRHQGHVYVTCNDLEHNIHLIAEYSTVNVDIGPVLPLSKTVGESACP